jgi:hypothetical protein
MSYLVRSAGGICRVEIPAAEEVSFRTRHTSAGALKSDLLRQGRNRERLEEVDRLHVPHVAHDIDRALGQEIVDEQRIGERVIDA